MKDFIMINNIGFQVLLILLLPYLCLWYWINNYSGYAYIISMLTVGFAYYLTNKSISAIVKYPSRKTTLSILPTTIFWFIIVWIGLRVFGLPYSIWYLILGWSLTVAFSYLNFRVQTNKQTILAYIPFDRAANAHSLPEISWLCVTEPAVPNNEIDGYVTDLRSSELTSEWKKFLSEQILKGIPVYHIRQMEETLTGRVKIEHMYENDLGSLLPSKNYMQVKYLIDCVLIIMSLPIVLPIMLITAIAIRLESEGNVLFIQNRVGQGGKEFKIYKFRSMSKDSEKHGAQMASVGDMRVTKIGQFIRKVRIDELPQFWNVLKGDMSLIGPRPEQKAFVDEFDDKIPFYNYRHIVKPGISGWAQVTHGYAADAEETQVKIEHDFYYIKHFSFSLDVLIFFKTIKTMLTGFGAR